MNKKYFFIISTILILSLFNTSIIFFSADKSSKTISEINIEKDVLEKDKDDKILSSSLSKSTDFHTFFKDYLYVKSFYTYLDTNLLLRPPDFYLSFFK